MHETLIQQIIQHFGSLDNVPEEFKPFLSEINQMLINGVVPAGQAGEGPLAEAPPVGADLQNLWYESNS